MPVLIEELTAPEDVLPSRLSEDVLPSRLSKALDSASSQTPRWPVSDQLILHSPLKGLEPANPAKLRDSEFYPIIGNLFSNIVFLCEQHAYALDGKQVIADQLDMLASELEMKGQLQPLLNWLREKRLIDLLCVLHTLTSDQEFITRVKAHFPQTNESIINEYVLETLSQPFIHLSEFLKRLLEKHDPQASADFDAPVNLEHSSALSTFINSYVFKTLCRVELRVTSVLIRMHENIRSNETESQPSYEYSMEALSTSIGMLSGDPGRLFEFFYTLLFIVQQLGSRDFLKSESFKTAILAGYEPSRSTEVMNAINQICEKNGPLFVDAANQLCEVAHIGHKANIVEQANVLASHYTKKGLAVAYNAPSNIKDVTSQAMLIFLQNILDVEKKSLRPQKYQLRQYEETREELSEERERPKKRSWLNIMFTLAAGLIFVAGVAGLAYLTVLSFGMLPALLGLSMVIQWSAAGSTTGAGAGGLLVGLRKRIAALFHPFSSWYRGLSRNEKIAVIAGSMLITLAVAAAVYLTVQTLGLAPALVAASSIIKVAAVALLAFIGNSLVIYSVRDKLKQKFSALRKSLPFFNKHRKQVVPTLGVGMDPEFQPKLERPTSPASPRDYDSGTESEWSSTASSPSARIIDDHVSARVLTYEGMFSEAIEEEDDWSELPFAHGPYSS